MRIVTAAAVLEVYPSLRQLHHRLDTSSAAQAPLRSSTAPRPGKPNRGRELGSLGKPSSRIDPLHVTKPLQAPNKPMRGDQRCQPPGRPSSKSSPPCAPSSSPKQPKDEALCDICKNKMSLASLEGHKRRKHQEQLVDDRPKLGQRAPVPPVRQVTASGRNPAASEAKEKLRRKVGSTASVPTPSKQKSNPPNTKRAAAPPRFLSLDTDDVDDEVSSIDHRENRRLDGSSDFWHI